MAKIGRRILISGGSGLIGSAVQREARERGMEVTTLVRRHRQVQGRAIYWNPGTGVHPMALEGFDAIIHLSGATVARRWTEKYRREIVKSRVGTTRTLCEALANVRQRPRVLVCASAVGIYGDRGDEVLTENSGPGAGFLAETCQAWEAAVEPARQAGIRVVHTRFGVVLSREGGALAKMLPVFRLGLGGRLGSGQQWMSWIGVRDAVRAMFFLMERDELAGAFNVTASESVTNAEFTKALGKAVHRPAALPVPAGVLRLIFGAMADETLLASQRVLPQRLTDAGFVFEGAEIGTVLHTLLG